MKAMWAGFAVMVLIAFGAYYVLNDIGFSSQERNTGASVRLD